MESTKAMRKANQNTIDEKFALDTNTAVQVELATQATPQINNSQIFSQLGIAIILALVDIAGLTISIYIAIVARIYILPLISSEIIPAVPPGFVSQLWWVLSVGILCLAYENLYTRRLPFWRETRILVKAITLAFIFMFAIISIGQMSNDVSRVVLILGYLVSMFLLPLGRLAIKTILAQVGLGTQSVLILGAGKTGELVAHALLRDKLLGYRIAGFLDEYPAKRAKYVEINNVYFPVLGSFRESNWIIEQTGARHLIVAAPDMPAHKLVGLVNQLQHRVASVTVIPDLVGVPVMGVEADYSFDEQILSLRIRNNLSSPLKILTKRLFDLVMGTIILILALPFMLLIAVAIKLDTPGPVVFSQSRIGKNGKAFKCYKFRTMYLDNEEILQEHLEENPKARREWERYAKLRGYDPRVTRAGRLLRKFSLDELPQIFNVLKGDMSLVGPRPYLLREATRISKSASSILMSRPGITGLWQVSGRNEIDFEGRLQLESWYVRNWSLWLDITLLIRTVGVVLARRGAY